MSPPSQGLELGVVVPEVPHVSPVEIEFYGLITQLQLLETFIWYWLAMLDEKIAQLFIAQVNVVFMGRGGHVGRSQTLMNPR